RRGFEPFKSSLTMSLKFETFFRGYVIVLVVLLFWAVWVAAQPAATNAPTDKATNATRLIQGIADGSESYLTFGLDRAEYLRRHAWFGEPLWKYVASLIYIFLAFCFAKFLDYLTRVWLKNLAAKTETKLDDLLVDLLSGPVKMICFVLLLYLGLALFHWPAAV